MDRDCKKWACFFFCDAVKCGKLIRRYYDEEDRTNNRKTSQSFIILYLMIADNSGTFLQHLPRFELADEKMQSRAPVSILPFPSAGSLENAARSFLSDASLIIQCCSSKLQHHIQNGSSLPFVCFLCLGGGC